MEVKREKVIIYLWKLINFLKPCICAIISLIWPGLVTCFDQRSGRVTNYGFQHQKSRGCPASVFPILEIRLLYIKAWDGLLVMMSGEHWDAVADSPSQLPVMFSKAKKADLPTDCNSTNESSRYHELQRSAMLAKPCLCC